MKLTFLGTSHGVPSATRHCTSMLLEVGDNLYVFDAGAPIADIFEQRHITHSKVKAFFITHMHGDHMNGLFSMLDLMMWYYKGCHPQVYLPEKEGISLFENYLSYLLDADPHDFFAFHQVLAGEVYRDEAIRVTAIPTLHIRNGERPSFAFVVEAEGKRILLNGDLTASLVDFPKEAYAGEYDAMVAELAHCSVNDLMARVMPCKLKRLIITHVWKLEKYDQIKSKASFLPFPVLFPDDGSNYEI